MTQATPGTAAASAQPPATPYPPLPDPLVSIIIPIFNEERLIRQVLQRVRALPFRKQMILVDDCSVDATASILESEEAPRADTIVLHHRVNQGKGAAIRSGLAHATGDIVLIQDADLEYFPEELPRLIEPLVAGQAQVVYGSRFMGTVRRMRLANRVGNWLLARSVSLLYGQRITDEATAYKIFRREVIQDLPLCCQRFEFCPEVTAKVLRRGVRILELPVSFEARTPEEGKKIGWRDFITAMRVLLRCRF